jgi:glycyl-tRNA synthetase (class II)
MVDSSYTKERFRLDKVIAGVKKVQSENPDNSDLKEIVRQLEIIKNNNQDIYSK